MKHLPKLLLWLPAALWYRVIWGFSAQTAAVSGDLSDRLLWRLMTALSPAFAAGDFPARSAAVELLRKGYDVRVGCYRDSEVDFLAVRYDIMEYFQVCQTLMSDDTRKREIKPLMRPKDNYPKTILTLDRFGLGNENGIQIKNVLDWLME